MRRKIMTTAGLACIIAAMAGWAAVYGEDKAGKKAPTHENIKEMMAKVHKGDRSPLANVQKELKAETPDWVQVSKNAKVLGDMAEMLRIGGPYSYSERIAAAQQRVADRYADSVKDLDKAASNKDRKAATAALTGMTNTCSSCHPYNRHYPQYLP